MSDNIQYHPSLSDDGKYLTDVSKMIKARQPIEEIKFEYLTEALQALGFSEDPYALVSLENLNPEDLKTLVAKSFEKINAAGLTDEIKNKLQRLWDYLAEEDKMESSDLIFVFGGGPDRAREGIKLWKETLAPKILFTGQKAVYMEDPERSEAECYADMARQEGLPDEAMILEKTAINTVENAKKSAQMLRESGFLPRRIILITNAFHMRRGYLTFKAVAEWNPVLLRHPVPSAKFNRENYFLSQNGWLYVVSEYIKMYGARLMKHF